MNDTFFFDSIYGLVLLAVLIVFALCLLAVPFLMLARLTRIEKALAEICEREQRRTDYMDTINRNLGQLLLHLPRMLKETGRAERE